MRLKKQLTKYSYERLDPKSSLFNDPKIVNLNKYWNGNIYRVYRQALTVIIIPYVYDEFVFALYNEIPNN